MADRLIFINHNEEGEIVVSIADGISDEQVVDSLYNAIEAIETGEFVVE